MSCSVLQCVTVSAAVCCSVMQCVVVGVGVGVAYVLQFVAISCSLLQC